MEKAALSGLAGLALALGLAGCEGGLGKMLTYSVPSRQETKITYSPYLEQMNSISQEHAESAIKSKDYVTLKKSIRTFLDNEQLERAEKYALELFRIDEREGREAYGWLQEYRNSHQETGTKQENMPALPESKK